MADSNVVETMASRVSHSQDLLSLENKEVSRDEQLNKLLNVVCDRAKSRTTFRTQQNPVLDNVRDFLPKMQKANDDLAKLSEEDAKALNIEVEDNDSDQLIQMDLALVELENDSSTNAEDSISSSDDDATESSLPACRTKKIEEVDSTTT